MMPVPRDPDAQWNAMAARGMPSPVRQRTPTDPEWNAAAPPPAAPTNYPQMKGVNFADTSVRPMDAPPLAAPAPAQSSYVSQYKADVATGPDVGAYEPKVTPEGPPRDTALSMRASNPSGDMYGTLPTIAAPRSAMVSGGSSMPNATGGQAQARAVENEIANQQGYTMPNATGGQAQLRAVDNQLMAQNEQTALSDLTQRQEAARQGVNYATAGSGFMLRGMRDATPGMTFNSNYGYGDTITATADKSGRLNQFSGFNPLPGGAAGGAGPAAAAAGGVGGPTAQRLGMAPGLGGELHAARMAALGRGESINVGSGGDYAAERMPEPQAAPDTSHRFDQDIARMGSSSDITDQWRARRMSKIRDMEMQAQTGRMQAGAAQQQAGAAVQSVNQQIPLEQMRQRGQMYGHDVSLYGHQLGAATTQRGQDIGAATTRRGQDVGLRGHEVTAEAHRYGADVGAQHYLPGMKREEQFNKYIQKGDPESARIMMQAYHPGTAQPHDPKITPIGIESGGGVAYVKPGQSDPTHISAKDLAARQVERENAAETARLKREGKL